MRFLVGILIATAFAGCVAEAPERTVVPVDVGYDPGQVHIAGTRFVEAMIPSFDGVTEISALIRVPVLLDPANTTYARFPVVLFLHGWAGSKESYAGGRGPIPVTNLPGRNDILEAFAEEGFIAVAYDARGFGESGGFADVAGPATMGDLVTVIDWVEARFPASGRVGVVGMSYGGGQALLALAREERVDAAVAGYGWADLADGLVPGNVPKLAWAQTLYWEGIAGSKVRYDAMIHDWYRKMYTRDGMDALRAQMDARSAIPEGKPLLVCQGLEETLFPHAAALARAPGFVRTYLYSGGHGTTPAGCWERALDWFHFFLAGFDTRVDGWPMLETSDALVAGTTIYADWPEGTAQRFHLRAPDLAGPSTATFTIRQSLAAGASPSVLSDVTGGPRPPIPESLSPSAAWTSFATPRLEEPRLLLGAPRLELVVADGEPPFQVAGELVALRADGRAVVLGHAAAATLVGDTEQARLVLDFPWTHAQFNVGDRIQLRLAANDPGWWMPILDDYSVSFSGASTLDLPFA